MLPVRKPGRPLSTCPHPPNQGCSCASVTAAISRSRKCGCGTSGSASPSTTTKAPKSPSKRSFHKPSTSPALPRSARADPAAFEQTPDASQLHVHPLPASNWSHARSPATINGVSPIPGNPQSSNSFMLPAAAGPVSYYSGQGEPSALFPQHQAAAVSMANGYQNPNQPGSHMYANGPTDFSAFFANSMDMTDPLGQMPLSAHGFDDMGLDLGQPMAFSAHAQPNGLNGFHDYQFSSPHTAPPTDATPLSTATAATPAGTSTKRSCCAPAAAASKPMSISPRHTPTSSIASFTSNAGTTSCRSSSPVSSSSSASQHTMLKSESTTDATSTPLSSVRSTSSTNAKPNGTVNGDGSRRHRPDYQAVGPQAPLPTNGPAMLHTAPYDQSMYANYSQHGHGAPAWYRYPPEYGTVTAPLQPAQWRSGLTVMTVPNAGMFNNGLQFEGLSMQPSYSGAGAAGGPTMETDDSHMCTCGDDCECVGCVAHPFNNATRNTIQSAWSTLMDDASSATSSTRTVTAATLAASQRDSGAATDGASPQQMPTPSDTSGLSEDQVSLPAGDFLFVSYSVAGCDGEGTICPCGDDCQCVGCTIHNNAPRL
ncbi:copper-activated transcription factor [Niveomyces insectorum RCEF 264]|uniref:Copper-activated transcription factor n=1 Tax=Niveomyces insectorum RCEF 264 TaxID=1081102 RepID=A0A167ZVD9_9HYPO|nr:copper-activated transcription factor [Niveomyces insectorum RCEF 264]